MNKNSYKQFTSRTRLWKGVLGSLLMTLLCVSHVDAQYLSEDFEATWVGSGPSAAPPGWVQSSITNVASTQEESWAQGVMSTGTVTYINNLGASINPAGTEPTLSRSGANSGKFLLIDDGNLGAPANNIIRRIVSPTFSLSAATSPYVRFFFAANNASIQNNLRLIGSNDGGATWVILKHLTANSSVAAANVGMSNGWMSTNVPIPASWVGNTNVRIGFEITNGPASNAYLIDDLTVADFTPTTITSAASGAWNLPATWVGGVVPTADNHVVIATGHTVTAANDYAACQNLTIDGTFHGGSSTTVCMRVFGNLTISSTGRAHIATTATTAGLGRTIHVGGNIVNNGALSLQTSTTAQSANTLVFNGHSGSNYSGTGTLTDGGGVTANGRIATLVAANSGGVTFSNAVTINSNLGLVNGQLDGTNVTIGNALAAASVFTTSVADGTMTAVTYNNTNIASRALTYSISPTIGGATFRALTAAKVINGSQELYGNSGNAVTGTLTLNTQNNLTLTAPVTIGQVTTGGVTFTRGIITTTATNILTLNCGAATFTGAAPSTTNPNPTTQGSYVFGPVRMVFPTTGSTARLFPLGLGNALNPGGLYSSPTSNRYIPFQVTGGTWAANMDFTASIESSAPSGSVVAPATILNSNISYRLVQNGSAALPGTAQVILTGNNYSFGNSDNMQYGAVEQLCVAQATSNTGPWTGRTAFAAGSTAIGVNTNRTATSATVAPGPIAGNGEYFTLASTAALNWTVGTVAATQVTGPAVKGSTNAAIMSINIPVSGVPGFGGQTLTNITFRDSLASGNGGNTNAATDITNVRLWTTGSSSVFNTPTLVAGPISFSGGFATFSGLSAALSLGSNFFWVTYDVSATATTANLLDILVPVGGITIAPTAPGVDYDAVATFSSPLLNPTGTRTVDANAAFNYGITRADNISFTSIQSTLGGGGTPMFNIATPTATNDDQLSPSLLFSSFTPAFAFNYQGTACTQIKACTNGWATLSAANTSNAWTNDLSTTSSTTLATLAPYWDDLRAFPLDPTGSTLYAPNLFEIQYKIDGTAPDRTLTIEWHCYSFGNTGPDVDMYFQVILYEAGGANSNRIEYRYGNFSAWDGLNSFGYSYSTGMTGFAVGSNIVGNVLSLQQENTDIFTNVANNNLTGTPFCFSSITFTPGAPYSGGTPLPAITNDNCATAIPISLGGSAPANYCTKYRSTGATNSGVPLPASISTTNPDDDVWFSWSMLSPNDVSIFCPGEGGYNPVVEVFSGSCASLTSVRGVDDNLIAGGREIFSLSALPAGDYFLRVFHAGPGFGQTPTNGSNTISADGYFALEAYKTPSIPSNDNLAGAKALTLGATCVNSYTGEFIQGATASPQAVCAGTADDDVWYSFVAVNGSTTVTVTSVGGFDAHLEIMNATGTASLGCVNATGVNGTETLTVPTTPGLTYLARVYHTGSGGSLAGSFNICGVTTPTPPACSTLSSPANAASVYGPSGVTLTWTASALASSYEVYLDNNTTPTTLVATVSAPTTTYTSAALGNGTFYWRIVPVNFDGSATGCAIRNFVSTTCPQVTNLGVTNIGATTADLTWTAHPSQTTFDVEIGLFGFTPTGTPTNAGVAQPFSVSGLALGLRHSYYVRNTCGGAWVGPFSFYTLPCEPVYTTGKTAGDLLSRVSIPTTTLDNNTGVAATNPAYTYFTGAANLTASLQAGTTYSLQVSIGTWGDQGIAAWIDFDDDGVYEASEKVGNTVGTIGTGTGNAGDELLPSHTASFPISLPCNPSVGPHRMRVRDVYATSGASIDPCASYTFGETEDYTITVLAPPPCPSPSAGTVSNITLTGADLAWVIGCTETSWDVHVTAAGGGAPSGAPSNAGVSTNPFSVTGLANSTNYEFWVRAVCGGGNGNSTWVGPYPFTTLTPPPANDDCAGAISVAVNTGLTCTLTTPGTITSATASVGATSGCGTYDDDVWFSFVATATTHPITITPVTGVTDLTHMVLDGCASPTSLVCSDPNTSVASGLTIGNTYYIRVASWTSTAGQVGTFTVCVGTPPPPPANDECVNAVPVTVNPALTCTATTAGTFTSATASAGPASVCGTYDDDVWFSFVATSTAHTITLTSTSGTADLTHQVLASCGAGTALVCSDPNTSAVNGLTIGSTYYIRVATWTSTSNQVGNFTVCVGTPPPPPANDECVNAITVPVNADLACGSTVAGTVLSATASTGAASVCGTYDDDVWFKFVATQTSHAISLVNVAGSTTDMTFQVVDACGATPTVILCSDPNSGNATGLTIGNTYYIRVATWSSTSGQTSTFNVCVGTIPPPPANDAICNAITLTPGAGCTPTFGNLYSATDEGVFGPTSCGGSNLVDVWFKFVAPVAVPANSAQVTISTELVAGGVTDGAMELYSMTSGTPCSSPVLSSIDCDDDTNGLLPVIVATGLTSGQTYYVRFKAFSAAAVGNGNYRICAINAGSPPPAIDNIANALNIPANNNWYPQCQLYSGDCSLSSNSPESSNGGGGVDNWYRFVANSTTVSIEMFSASMNNFIELVQQTGPSTYVSVNYEDATSTVGATERLNYQGLVIGQTYYVAVGAVGAGTGGAYQVCVKQLLASGCNTSVASPLSNCSTFKATWTGANTYTYQFLPVGASIGGGSLTGTGSISLANASLNLVPGNTYNVIVNATYNLTNGLGVAETFTVFGANPSCANVQIVPHASIEVRASQRCSAPATLLKTSFMRTDPFVCGVTNYTYEFQKVTDCTGSANDGLPFTYNNNSRIISLNFPSSQTVPTGQTITPQSYYRVRVRPNFGTLGVNQGTFGNPQVIFVGGSVLETEQQLSEMAAEAERMDEESMLDAMIYPNPSNGEVVNLNVANVTSDNVFVRIMDATGRIVYTNRYTVDGSLNTIVTFAQPLANGLYTVEFIMDDQRITERMMIQK